jgi:hypothetical protein
MPATATQLRKNKAIFFDQISSAIKNVQMSPAAKKPF